MQWLQVPCLHNGTKEARGSIACVCAQIDKQCVSLHVLMRHVQFDHMSMWVCRAQAPGMTNSLGIKPMIRCGGPAPVVHSKHLPVLLAGLSAPQQLKCSHSQEYCMHSQKQVTSRLQLHSVLLAVSCLYMICNYVSNLQP